MKKRIIAVSLFGLLLAACQAPTDIPAQPDDTPPAPASTTRPVQAPAAEPLSETAVPPKAARVPSGELVYLLLSGEIALQRNQFELALRAYSRALELVPDPRLAERTARIAVYLRDDDLALQAARHWVELEPENLEARQVIAALLVRNGMGEQALEHLEQLLLLTPRSEANGFMLITSLLSKERDKQAAIEVMENLVARHDHSPEALFALAHLALLVNDLDKAADAIDAALARRPDWSEGQLLRANILQRQGNNERLMRVLNEALALRPDDIPLRLFLARKLVDDKQYEAAREQFGRILHYQPGHADALYAQGLLGLQVNDLKIAEQSFLKLISLGERVDEARYYLGQAAELREQFDKAIDHYELIHGGRFYIDARIRAAAIMARQGKLDAAREYLQNVSADSLEGELRLYLAEGELLRKARDYEEAFRLYTLALQHIPDNTQLQYARALTAEKLDKLEVTIEDLEAIIAREPDNPDALNALGYTLVDQTDRIETGIAYIQRAIKLKPDDPAIIDSLGWAYYRKGEYDRALNYLRRAFELLKDGEIAAHLGEVLWVTGEKSAARKVWEDALRDDPEHQLLRNVIQRFSE